MNRIKRYLLLAAAALLILAGVMLAVHLVAPGDEPPSEPNIAVVDTEDLRLSIRIGESEIPLTVPGEFQELTAEKESGSEATLLHQISGSVHFLFLRRLPISGTASEEELQKYQHSFLQIISRTIPTSRTLDIGVGRAMSYQYSGPKGIEFLSVFGHPKPAAGVSILSYGHQAEISPGFLRAHRIAVTSVMDSLKEAEDREE